MSTNAHRLRVGWVKLVCSSKWPRWAKAEDAVWPDEVEPGVRYRLMWGKGDGHLSDPRYPDVSLCGQTLIMDVDLQKRMYDEARAQGNDLPGTLFLDTRKGGECSPCKTRWKNDKAQLEAEAEQLAEAERLEAESREYESESNRKAVSGNPYRLRAEQDLLMAKRNIVSVFGRVEEI